MKNYFDELQELFNSDGVVDCVEFDIMAGKVLREEGYQEGDLDNMSKDDMREKIEELFMMKLEEDGNNVYLVEYIND